MIRGRIDIEFISLIKEDLAQAASRSCREAGGVLQIVPFFMNIEGIDPEPREAVIGHLARVGEGIVTTIGSTEHHKKVLENPDLISKVVLSKGLDSGTAFEILSIDIADVNIGKNIGAQLQTDQANADKNIAQAKAEERRAMAVASEQEMKARISEMRAQLIAMEAQVPLALAQAFREGRFENKEA